MTLDHLHKGYDAGGQVELLGCLGPGRWHQGSATGRLGFGKRLYELV